MMLIKDPSIRIQFYDLNDRLGGAWYSDYSPKGHEIECGCHIWSYSPEAYDFIQEELGVVLAPFETKPTFIGKVINLPYSAKQSVDSYKYILKSLATFKSGFAREVKERPYLTTKVFGKNNLYPKKGSPELTNRLKELLDATGRVEFNLSSKITRLEVGVKVRLLSDETNFEADRVILTSVSEVRSIKSSDHNIDITPFRRDYIHLLLGSDKPFKKIASYWRLMNDPVIHRISDISYQTNKEENLMLLGIKEEEYYKMKPEELMVYCKNYLLGLKLIDETFQLQDIKHHIFPTYYIDEDVRDQINKVSPDQLQILHTTDIMYGVYYLIKEYET